MKRLIRIENCKECPHSIEAMGGSIHCVYYMSRDPERHEALSNGLVAADTIPNWCPLEEATDATHDL